MVAVTGVLAVMPFHCVTCVFQLAKALPVLLGPLVMYDIAPYVAVLLVDLHQQSAISIKGNGIGILCPLRV